MKEKKIKSTFDAIGLIGLIFSIMGIVFLLVSGGFFITNYMFMKDASKTVGVITDIEQYSGNKSKNENNAHTVTVKYTIDGHEYTEQLNEYSSDMRIGKEITLYYHPGKEEDVRTGEVSIILSIVFGLIGLGFGLCGLIFVLKNKRRLKKAKWLRENGKRRYAMVNECVMNKKMRVNGRHPFMLKCRYVDEFTGEEIWYCSAYTLVNLGNYIGNQIIVYVDPSDEKSYEVDLNSLLRQE